MLYAMFSSGYFYEEEGLITEHCLLSAYTGSPAGLLRYLEQWAVDQIEEIEELTGAEIVGMSFEKINKISMPIPGYKWTIYIEWIALDQYNDVIDVYFPTDGAYVYIVEVEWV